MKRVLTKALALVSLALPLIFSGCESAKKASSSDSEAGSLLSQEVFPSKHVAIPDTSSKIVTEAQPMEKGLTAQDFTVQMGLGINLGNTMEAVRAPSDGITKPVSYYEKLWGQPETTEAIIKGYKAAGFDTIRIPVAWTNGMDFENGDYTIKTELLDRVEQIVKWAIDADMTVILNDHWDLSWWGMFGSARNEIRESAWELYEAMWTQIGTRFKNYSYKLIFEGGNEELGDGLNDNRTVADSGTLSNKECYEVANKINQKFVDTIRSLGGNNETRFLLIPGIGTDITKTCDAKFTMPTDKVEGRLFLSVHFYDPSPFCLGGGDLWGTQKDLGNMNGMLEKLLKFYDKGYGIIIGEYGALPQEKEYKSATKLWTENFLDNCALNNYCPVLWDIGEWGFYDKTACKLNNEEFASIIKEYSRNERKNLDRDDIMNDAEDRIADRLAAAPKILSDNPLVGRTDVGIGYLMFADKNWAINYSMGDEYNPDSKTKGMKAFDVEIKGEGTYTVGFDLTEANKNAYSMAFSAIGIDNGEKLFPGYIITIKEIKIDGNAIEFKDNYYTASDDGDCTRVNLFNEWVNDSDVKKVKSARKADGDLTKATACPVNRNNIASFKKIEVTFDYGPAK